MANPVLLRSTLLRPVFLVAIASRAQSFINVVPPWGHQHQTSCCLSSLLATRQAQHRLASSSVGHDEDTMLQTGAATTFESNIDEDDDEDFDDDDDDFDDDDDIDYSESSVQPSYSQRLYEALSKSIISALTSLTKKKASLENELAKAQQLETTMNRANLIVSNLYRLPPGTTEAEVEDWENDGSIVKLELNTKDYATFQEESDALFAAARKMKRGSAVVEELLAKTVEGEQALNDAQIDLLSMESSVLDEGTMLLIQKRLERTSKETGWKPPKIEDDSGEQSKPRRNTTQKSQGNQRRKPNPRELTSPSGHKVLVGRNRRDNEAICFALSKPTDIWMHARGCPGAHVLLCVRRGSPEVTDEDLQFAADLAAFYSDARTERRAEITTAEPKHITKPRGAPPGAVTLRQEGKTLLGKPEDVAEELKEARELSGANWSELGYRKLGKRANNKKKTAAVEKETAKKRREEARENNKRRKRKEETDWF
jgi:predicted ribosome quality control (RQC) complex YloA/Tae2 family protein